MKLDLREGLPLNHKLEPGDLFMLDTFFTSMRNRLFGPGYVYYYFECDVCGHRGSIPWPKRQGIDVFCRHCGKEIFL